MPLERALTGLAAAAALAPHPALAVRDLAPAHGVRLRRVQLQPAGWWQSDHGPLLAFDAAGLPVPLLRHGRGYARRSGTGGMVPLDVAGAAELVPYGFMAYPRFSAQRGGFAGVLRRGIATALVWSVAAAVARGVPALALMPLLDGEGAAAVIGVVPAAAAWVLARHALRVRRRRLGVTAGVAAHIGVWNRLLDRPLWAFRRRAPGDVAHDIGDVLETDHERLEAADRLLVHGPAVLLAPAVVAVVDPGLALVVAGGLAGAFVVGWAAERAVVRAVRLREQGGPARRRLRRQFIGALPVLRTLGVAEWFAGRVLTGLEGEAAHMNRALLARCRAERAVAAAGAVLAALSAVAILVGVVGPVTVGMLVAAVSAAWPAAAAAVILGGGAARVRDGQSRGRALDAVLSLPADTIPGLPPVGRIQTVAFDGVGFSYPGTGVVALSDLSLSVAGGEVLALTGPSGGGKTTAVRLLAGLERPDHGRILVNGRDLAGLDRGTYRQRIGAVFQDEGTDVLTVRGIILGTAPLPLDAAWEAARLARLDRAIAAMPMGMQTLVSEASFPASLVQQLLLARAIARAPDLMLLDEALASLDDGVQAGIVADLKAAGMAVVVVSHRPSTLALADRVVRLGMP